jgi:hypothetical protein
MVDQLCREFVGLHRQFRKNVLCRDQNVVLPKFHCEGIVITAQQPCELLIIG